MKTNFLRLLLHIKLVKHGLAFMYLTTIIHLKYVYKTRHGHRRRQAAHLQRLSRLTNFTVSCRCVVNYSHCVLQEIRFWVLMPLWKKTSYWLNSHWLHCKQIYQLFFCCISDKEAAQGVLMVPPVATSVARSTKTQILGITILNNLQ